MSKTIRTYTTEFKQDAVQYVESHPEMTLAKVAENLGVPNEPIKGNLTEEEKEIIRLKKELRDTQGALEILKKAISILGE